MKVAFAYVFVVLVWSTTPLAIHFSNEGFSFVTAITLRIVLAFVCCYTLLRVTGDKLHKNPADWWSFLASGLGLFPTMLLVYWAAQYIPSGLMSVLMGVLPFFAGIVSIVVLKDNAFSITRFFALIMAVTGLVIINIDQLGEGRNPALGVMVMISVCVFWAISAVYVKKLGADISPLRQGTGSIAVALPFFLITWFVLDGEVPKEYSEKSLWAVGYLVIVGSVFSHTLWFYVLRHCRIGSVALVPLITPVMAITWGVLFANETLSTNTAIGSFVVLFSLAIYQGVLQYLIRFRFNFRRTVKGLGYFVVRDRVKVDVKAP